MNYEKHLGVTPEAVLLAQVRTKDSTSFMILFNRYRPLICKLWYQFHLTSTSLDDWQQEAALVLYRVVCNYSDQQTHFCWYLKQALTNRIRDLYRQQAAKKRVPACCLEPLTDMHVEVMAVDHHLGPAEVAEFRRTYHHFRDHCSQFEWTIFVEINQGFEVDEVADKLGCKRQCVRSALERAKKKFIQELA
ncbi:MAG TPA: sigma-70 family RNA polymerase sigma factor [Candidatus Limosilactobacillus merdigallinarum]|uniref:Sigma-70 family RNA polymerase sigma factor n=1 Tax=Candidatus Limosilactobacillus merdigallinarum TaxID=2838652 RepID=A0A9D1VIA5_9LACO|nr:sigma-70 family RNA polymerase sigma factor [Candidatus Limosilactobacillus merdigallinarum]